MKPPSVCKMKLGSNDLLLMICSGSHGIHDYLPEFGGRSRRITPTPRVRNEISEETGEGIEERPTDSAETPEITGETPGEAKEREEPIPGKLLHTHSVNRIRIGIRVG